MKNPLERVTVTLTSETIRTIDLLEKNRSKFVAEAVQREIERRQREALRKSLANPHPESASIELQGLDEWAGSFPKENTELLVSPEAGKAIRWLPEEGWVLRDEKDAP